MQEIQPTSFSLVGCTAFSLFNAPLDLVQNLSQLAISSKGDVIFYLLTKNLLMRRYIESSLQEYVHHSAVNHSVHHSESQANNNTNSYILIQLPSQLQLAKSSSIKFWTKVTQNFQPLWKEYICYEANWQSQI